MTHDLDKIRIAVAEKMGWKRNVTDEVFCNWWLHPTDGTMQQHPPNYPTSLDACRPVIERLKEEGWFGFELYGNDGNWSAHFENDDDLLAAEATDPALAICLAALKVWGIDPETL